MALHPLLFPLLLAQAAPEASPPADPEDLSVPDPETGKIEGRRRPGYSADLPDAVRQDNPGAVRAPPPQAFPTDQIPVPDRWRIMTSLCPAKGGDQSIFAVFGAMREVCHSPLDPYHQNTLKGDLPLREGHKPGFLKGDDWFLSLNLTSDSVIEPRSFPIPVGVQTTERPNSIDVFGRNNSLVLSQTFIAGAALIKGSTRYDDLKGADLVIEAATENLELKLRILRQVEGLVGDSTVIASNTSSISITQMAAVLAKPERAIGLHFFNPVPMMALVEVIRGLQTSDATHALAVAFAEKLGKTPITVKNQPGFVVNRILCPMINEAIFVLAEGAASAEDIDTGMKLGCNHPIGPLALADMIGLDTMLAVMNVFYDGFNDPKYRPAPLLKEMVAAGRLGRKTGRGFYSYE